MITSLLIGFVLGFFLCWFAWVRPLSESLVQREAAVSQWERLNRQERENIADIKAINIEGVRSWVAALDEQNRRFAELQSLLHRQRLSLVGPSRTHLWLAILLVFIAIGFSIWMQRDANADAARTLDNVIAVLPPLRDMARAKALVTHERRQIGTGLLVDEARLPARMRGTVQRLFTERGYGFIRPNEGDDEVFFHRNGMRPGLDFGKLSVGDLVTFRMVKDQAGRVCAEVIDFGD